MRCRGEFDWGAKNSRPPYPAGSASNWFTVAPQWNVYWTAVACLTYGLDMWNIDPTLLRDGRANEFRKSFEFFNRYAGQKLPETAQGTSSRFVTT